MKWLDLQSVQFHGGELRLASDAPRGEGIQFLGRDFAAIVKEDRLFLIPYAALHGVSGSHATSRNHLAQITFRSVISEWIDPDVNPDNPNEMIWHYFITRRRREHRGAILGVSDKGVRLRLKRRRELCIPWSRIGAAIEILE